MSEIRIARITRERADGTAGDQRVRAESMLAGDERTWSILRDATAPAERDPPTGAVVRVQISDEGALVLERLAEPGTARAEMYGVALAAGLDPVVRRESQAEADALAAEPGLDDPTLRDMESIPFVTIDNDDSRDLDQAMYLERTDDGFRVLYALADASYYVRPGTALFADAMSRGATYYLPGLAVPMLPRVLSEGIVSLNPDVLRRAMVFDMELDADGRARRTTVVRARIRSQAKLAYDGVQRWFDRDADAPALDDQPFAESLRTLAEVGRLRMALAIERDVVRYRRQEVEIKYGPQGTSFVALAEDRNDVERWNEQVSLLCNTEGARLLIEAMTPDRRENLQAVFRVHAPPHHRQVDQLESFVRRWVEAAGLDESVWGWRRSDEESLAAYLARLPADGEGARRRAKAVHRQALVINQRSRFDKEPGPHYGVGADHYARFSAPMREMVGIFTHKELMEWLDGQADQPPTFDDEALRETIVDRANAAKRIQSKLNKRVNRLAIDPALSAATNTSLRGTLMGLTKKRAYVHFDTPPVEVKVYFDTLERHGVRLHSEDDVVLVHGEHRWAIGDAIDLRVQGREPGGRGGDRWVLVPVPPGD